MPPRCGVLNCSIMKQGLKLHKFLAAFHERYDGNQCAIFSNKFIYVYVPRTCGTEGL